MDTLKLSQAIRLGSMLKPQAFNSHTKGHSCALQAACDAVGVERACWPCLHDWFPILHARVECPLQCAVAQLMNLGRLDEIVWHLNDSHGWSRERIANLVEQIEKQLESEPSEDEKLRDSIARA